MQASHSVSAVFDDPNLVSVAGLVLALARRAGLHDLAAEHLSVPGPFAVPFAERPAGTQQVRHCPRAGVSRNTRPLKILADERPTAHEHVSQFQ